MVIFNSDYFDTGCFSPDYQKARVLFLKALDQLDKDLIRQQACYRHPCHGPDGLDLFMDWVQLGQMDEVERLLVLISGTHGVEGLTGSAVQLYYLQDLAKQVKLDSRMGVIMIHALNPWGLAWLRRYDHEGIDINRNFVNFNRALPSNEIYKLIQEAYMSDVRLSAKTLIDEGRKRWGVAQFDAAITEGQYDYADGLFYGGRQPSWSQQKLQALAQNPVFQQARHIAVIDVHSGLGPYSYGEIINDHEPATPGFELASNWYGPHARSTQMSESCSAPKCGLLDYFWYELMGSRGCFVTLEFGTYSLEQLLVCSIEEQRYHNSLLNPLRDRDLGAAPVRKLQDFFYPIDTTWREAVLFRAGQAITMAIAGMRA